MVLQNRNHPSVILWGVRVNESCDDDELYTMTNNIAHELDKTRFTAGVRNFKKSNLLEDVYTYNDFLYDGYSDCIEKKKMSHPMKIRHILFQNTMDTCIRLRHLTAKNTGLNMH